MLLSRAMNTCAGSLLSSLECSTFENRYPIGPGMSINWTCGNSYELRHRGSLILGKPFPDPAQCAASPSVRSGTQFIHRPWPHATQMTSLGRGARDPGTRIRCEYVRTHGYVYIHYACSHTDSLYYLKVPDTHAFIQTYPPTWA